MIQKIRDSKKGWKFDQLFGGDWQEYPSQSEADQSLCSILAFWTGNDPIQIDGIFRQSGLFRKKWDENRGGQPYGEKTINKAISTNRETYKAPSD